MAGLVVLVAILIPLLFFGVDPKALLALPKADVEAAVRARDVGYALRLTSTLRLY